MYLFFDTETTGLNKSSDRVIQIAWLVISEDGNELRRDNRLIKPAGFEIPAAAERIHGISTIVANRFGVPLRQALLDLKKEIDSCEIIVGHNLSFDIAMLRPEFSREKIEFCVDEKVTVCTMRSSTAWCRLPKLDGRSGFKWPKLEELYYRLFGRYFEGAHDALADVVATKEVYFELLKRDIILGARIDDQTEAKRGPNKKGEQVRDVRLSSKIEKHVTATSKIPDLTEQKSGNVESLPSVFSWDWSAPAGEKIDLLSCPSCRSHCKHRINLRKRFAQCLTCFAEYGV